MSHREWAIEQIYAIGIEGIDQQNWFQRLAPEQKDAQLAHARIKAAEYADKLLNAIESKDINTLRLSIHNGNKTSKVIFTRVTGLKLGSTEKAIREVLRSYVGEEAWDRFYSEKEAEAERKQQEAAAKTAEAKRKAVLDTPVRYAMGGAGVVQTVPVRAVIDDLIGRGFRTLTTVKRGRFTDYHLGNGARHTVFRKKIEGEYIQEQLARVEG